MEEKLSDYKIDPSFGLEVEAKEETEKPKKRVVFRLFRNQEKARAIAKARKPTYAKLECPCGFWTYFNVLFESHERVNHWKVFPKHEEPLSAAEQPCAAERKKEDFYERPFTIEQDEGGEIGKEEIPLGEMGKEEN